MSTAKKVCLDPGHDGSNGYNKSPDSTLYEHEFALDMARRMATILERHGVLVTLTRTAGEEVSLEKRVAIANGIAGLDLFVSLHSNAAGNGGWYSARGWSIYTSSADAAAGRNIAANDIITSVQAAGVVTRNPALLHERFYVLRNTVAPAVLIEQGFHTNEEDVALMKSSAYRDTLAIAQCKGILDYLGIPWQEAPAAAPTGNQPNPWAKSAWDKAVSQGILDGSDPQGACTREMLAVVLDRLGLLGS